MPLFHPRIYIGEADSGDYFTSVLPPEAPGRLQSLVIREGQEEVRPFLRPRPDSLTAHSLLQASGRPFEPGHLCIVQVETDTGIEPWFRGILTQPHYETPNYGRVATTIPALNTVDLLRRRQTILERMNISHEDAFGVLLDGVGWPTASTLRVIDNGFSDTLDTWAIDDEPTLDSIEDILTTAGPPARVIGLRNGGLLVVRDVGTVGGNANFTDVDIYRDIDFVFDDRSLINQVVIGDDTFDATGSPSDDVRRSRLFVLPGLPTTGRAALAERIFDAYESGLTFVRFDLTITNPRVYDRARGLQIGGIVGVTAFGERRAGYVSSLEWRWQQTIARVRVGVVVKGNIIGIGSEPVHVYSGFTIFWRPAEDEVITPTPASMLAAPMGLALTESGGDITAEWNAVTDATGYVLEWREEGSGAAWQTVDVTAPPHTFTP